MGKITLNWTDNNTDEEGHRVYRSIGSPLDFDNMPQPVVDLGANVTEYIDEADFRDDLVFYSVSAYRSTPLGEVERYSDEISFDTNQV